ncbi:MAG: trypsin-like peptidase domain-containing protein [Oscillospiraceae bacterium]|nr:trypsin-like peptidase domain-containing protein [Oscillospiraceae bacterium]
MKACIKKNAIAAGLLCSVFLLFATVASAAQDVPKVVLGAKESVVRVSATTLEGISLGTGFVVEDDSQYVVTNCHVVEGADTVEVYTSSDVFTPGEVIYSEPGKDLCIIELQEPLNNVKGLSLSLDIEAGAAVYALGFPGAADDLSGTYSADKSNMSITDGIVSAVRQSVLVGEGGFNSWVLQTNTAINSGNSGGPLLNARGELVGINTLGMLDAQNINGCIHVRELKKVLDAAEISYQTTQTRSPLMGVPLICFAAGAVLYAAAIVLMLLLLVKHEKKQQKGVTLSAFLMQRTPLPPCSAIKAVLGLASMGAALPVPAAQTMLFAPNNLTFADGVLTPVKNKATLAKTLRPEAGTAAPELYIGACTEATAVYALACILHALISGEYPAAGQVSAAIPAEMAAVLQAALAADSAARTQTLAQLQAQLLTAAKQICPEGEALCAADMPKRRKGKALKIALVCAVFVMSVGITAFGAWRLVHDTQNGVKQALSAHLQYQDYVSAQKLVQENPWIADEDARLNPYIDAHMRLHNGDAQAASEQFKALGDYKDSIQLAKNAASYAAAAQSSDAVFKLNTYYELATFLDSKKRAEDAAYNLLEKAINMYEDGDIENPHMIEYFNLVAERYHTEADEYIQALQAHTDFVEEKIDYSELCNRLDELKDFIEVGPIYLSPRVIEYSIYGRWESVNYNGVDGAMLDLDDEYFTAHNLGLDKQAEIYYDFHGIYGQDKRTMYVRWKWIEWGMLEFEAVQTDKTHMMFLQM